MKNQIEGKNQLSSRAALVNDSRRSSRLDHLQKNNDGLYSSLPEFKNFEGGVVKMKSEKR